MKKQFKTIIYPSIARGLLKMGYKLVDIRPKKENLEATMFVFEVWNYRKFRQDMQKVIHDLKAKREY